MSHPRESPPRRAVDVPRDAPAAELLAAALAECVRCVAEGEAAAADSADGVHQLRVALRRLRGVLRLLRGAIGRERADFLRAALDPIAGVLGPVRDLDVLLESLAPHAAGTPALAEIAERAWKRRGEALAEAFALLASPERAQLDLELGRVAFGGEGTARPRGSAREAALRLAARADGRALRAGRGFARSTAAERHRLRLRVKAARYVVELFATLLPARRTQRYLRRARELQDVLGSECDVRRKRELLARLAPDLPAESVAKVTGDASGAAEAELRARAWRRFRRAKRPWERGETRARNRRR